MLGEIYAHFAVAYGGEPQPVIITDERLYAVYYNVCASQTAAFVMCEDFLRKTLSAQQRREIWQARKNHLPVSFFLMFGHTELHRYHVTMGYEAAHLVFRFTAAPNKAEQAKLRQQSTFLAPYQLLQSKPLHRLLMTGECLEQMPQMEQSSTDILQNVSLALGVTRTMNFIFDDPHCAIVDCKTYLTLLHKKLGPFLKEKLSFTLLIDKLPEQLPLKCDVRAFRSALVTLIKYFIHHGMDTAILSAGRRNDSAVILLSNNAAMKDRGLFVSTKSGNISHDNDFLLAQYQFDQQQYSLLAEHGPENAFRFVCWQPCSETEVVLKETVSDLMEEMLDVNQIEFSDLLYKE